MKRIVSMLLAVLLLLCSGVSLAEKQTVTWYGVDVEPASLIEAFNGSHEDIEVVYELVSTDNYFTTLNTRIMADECPDLFPFRTTDNYESLIAMDQILDLTEYDFMKNFTDGALTANTAKDGRVYAFPLAANYLNLFYNKTLFEKLGIAEPTNYQEYIHACETLKQNGVAPLVAGCKDLWQNRYVGVDPLQAVAAKDPTWLKKLYQYEAKFTDSIFLDQVKRVEEFVQNGYLYEGSLGLTMAQAYQVFAGGGAGMQLGATFYVQQAFPQAERDFEIGVCPLPVNDEGQEQVVFLHANMAVLSVNKKSKHLDAVIEFLEWFSNAENYVLFTTDNQTIVPTLKTMDYAKLVPEAALWKHFSNYKTLDRAMEPSVISTEFGQVMQNIVMGAYTAEQACEELQTAYESKKID